MANTPPLNIGAAGVAAKIDLTKLSDALLATPEALYIWTNYASLKFGPAGENEGSKVQVDRLKPLESPDPTNLAAYVAVSTFAALPDQTNTALFQALDWDSVTIQVERYCMPKPVAAKFKAMQLSQVDLEMAHAINLRRNFHEFEDTLIREQYRSHVCTQIFGKSLRTDKASMVNVPSTDGLAVSMLKKFKERAATLYLRAFGSAPGSDAQALEGSFLAVTDQYGINELSEDPLWRDYVIRDPSGERGRLVKGFIGEFEQITVVKSDRMATTQVGSGNAFTGHEIIFMASDPTLIETGEDGTQGFFGEYPVAWAQIGLPEVKRASEDGFGENIILRWYATLGTQALEEMDLTTAQAISTSLGGIAVATGSSRFIHRGLFV